LTRAGGLAASTVGADMARSMESSRVFIIIRF
jgi:hypothetical protein